MKKNKILKQKDFKPLSKKKRQELEDAFSQILFSKKEDLYENKKPTKEQLNQKFRLVKN